MLIQFKINKKYTVLFVGGLAQSVRQEIIITLQDEKGRFAFRLKKQRKQYYIPGDDELRKYLVFEGHDLPLVIDTDTTSWAGNARINFITDQPDELRDFILHNNLRSLFHNLSIITVSSSGKDVHSREYSPLFPEYPL